MDGIVEQEVEVLARSRFWLVALVVALAIVPGRAGASDPADCDVEPQPEVCSSVLIGLFASPNPTAPGGTVSFSASSYPWTDCWDSLGHSWWGDTAFSMAVGSPFIWTVYCMGNGIESSSLGIGVSDGGGGGGGGGGAGGYVPAVISAPTISGSAEEGQTLTAGPGSWTNDPTGFTYVWRRSGDLVEVGRGAALTLTSAHVGHQLRVDVQACNGTGCGSWASSEWTAAVSAALPEYDPAFAEGTDADEFFYTSLCSGKSCPAALMSSSAGATANAVCARVGGAVTKSNWLYRIWRMRHELNFCADRNRITRIWNRLVDGEILIPSWASSIYPWRWLTITDSHPGVGVWSSRSFARVRFEMCALFRSLGPLCRVNEPWIEITLYGDGNAICNSSTGRLRNCKVRL